MLGFIARRLLIGFMVLLASTFLMYVLVANAGDPLDDLRQDQSANKEEKIAARIAALHLDQPVPLRYLTWLRGVSGCVVGNCDLGVNRYNQQVATLLGQALTNTLKLVFIATVLAIVIGITVGIISALRQYSMFDYVITFVTFLFFSLPIFWVAVLLKQFVGIEANNWLASPTISPPVIAVAAILAGAVVAMAVGGTRVRQLLTFAIAGVASAGGLAYASAVEWFARPALGPGVVAIGALGLALLGTLLFAGFTRRRVLYATLAMAAAGIVSYFATGPVMTNPAWYHLVMLLLITVAVAVALGRGIGGALEAAQAIKACAFTGIGIGVLIYLDHLMQAFPAYNRRVGGRAVATIGAGTPNFTGNHWERALDLGLHVLLPTIALILISIASFTRYTRASMLEVLNQDYVRTARAKGLTERSVIIRHAFRNALIPVTTLVALAIAEIVGGAIVTERVFGWKGMGSMFITGLHEVDPNVVLGTFLVTGTTITVMNIVADVIYAFLDPRIRLS